MENILLTFFFMQLSKRETRPLNARLPLPEIRARLIFRKM
jgi:hypothetical protein